MKGHLRHRSGRPADYWELEVDAGRDPITRKRRRVIRSFRGGEREAENALAELVVEVNRGQGRGSTATFGDLLERWLDQLASTRSPTTLAEYRRIADKHLIPALGKTLLRKLDASRLDDLYAALLRKELSPTSVLHVHAVAHRALEVGCDWQWIKANPADHAHPPIQVPSDVRAPEPATLLRLLHKAMTRKGDRSFGVWLYMAAITGARRGEVCGLRWGDVDSAAKTLSIARAVVEADGRRLQVKSPKTHKGRRVALPATAIDILDEHARRMAKRAADAGAELDPDAYLFSDDVTGKRPWRPGRCTLAFCRLRDSLGITGVRLHDLRHFSATQLVAKGVDPRTVAGRLGHDDPNVTLNVYSQFVPQADRAAAELLDEIIGSPGDAPATPEQGEPTP